MPTPLYWSEKTLLFKSETTYGTDPVPTGAANAILATNVSLSPMEGQDVSRDLEMPWHGAQAVIAAGLYAKLSFRVEMKGSGTPGTAPVIGPLLKACKCAEVIVAATSVTYSRVTSNLGSATIYFNLGGTLFKLLGARGNVQVKVDAQGILWAEFVFSGIFVQPAAQTPPTPTLGTQLTDLPFIANSTNTPVFTIGGTPHVLRSLALDFGNAIEPRFLIGQHEMISPATAESLETTINAVPLATLDPFALAGSGTTSAIVLQHGTAAGKIMTLSVPRAQCLRPGAAQQSQGIIEWPLRWVPLPSGTGNDQLTLAWT